LKTEGRPLPEIEKSVVNRKVFLVSQRSRKQIGVGLQNKGIYIQNGICSENAEIFRKCDDPYGIWIAIYFSY
jgi:hypothetical protein